MNENFLNYKQSLAVKELGFDEPCLGYWNIDPYLPKPTFNMVRPFDHEWCVHAPLKQQIFRWFREKHNIHYPISVCEGIWYFQAWSLKGYKTYEEAEDACINKIIDAFKQKAHDDTNGS